VKYADLFLWGICMHDSEPALSGQLAPTNDIMLGANDSFEHIVQMLSHSDIEVRSRAVLALGETRQPQAVPVLLVLLHEVNWQIRISAVAALRHVRDERVTAALIELLQSDPEEAIRCLIVRSLAAEGSERSFQAVCNALRHDHSLRVRQYAVTHLSEFDTETVVIVLSQAYEATNSRELKRHIRGTLNKIGTPEARDMLRRRRPEVLESLVRSRPCFPVAGSY